VDGANGRVYWGNKFQGLTVGSVAGAAAAKPAGQLLQSEEQKGSAPAALETTPLVDSVTGVCASVQNVFYLDGKNGIFCVKKAGGVPTQVSSMLARASGCAWDGDGTVYVVDERAVYRLPANQATLRPMLNLDKVIDASGGGKWAKYRLAGENSEGDFTGRLKYF
jgi:hypothetical protein